MKTYTIIFEDIFSGAKETKQVALTEQQYQSAIKQKEAKTIVINKLINAIHWQLVISDIKEVSAN